MKKIYTIVFFLISLCGSAQEKLNIYFDFVKSDLNEVAVKKINSWIAEGKSYQVIKLYGFCDSKGTNLYNDTLAMKRVTEVSNYLKSSSIDIIKNIEIRGFGEDFQQSKIQDENRRVTIIFVEKKNSSLNNEGEKLSEQIKSSKKGDLIKLKNIYFFNNSAKTVPKSEPVLYDLFCAMNDNPNLKIEIQGHICCKRPEEYEDVSTARAKAIYNYLIIRKINRNRMTFKGYGVSKPVHPIPEKNSQEEDDNRRVEILIVNN